MKNKFDFIITGGGIIGMTIARELAVRRQKVALFERGNLGMEASWAAGGILSSLCPWRENPASFALSEQGKKIYPDYVAELKEETGIDAELVQSGLIIIEKKDMCTIKQWADSNHIQFSEDISDIPVNVHTPDVSILFPDIYQIKPPQFIKALRKSLEHLSVSIFENTHVDRIVTKNDEFRYIEYKGEKAYADAVIITAGAWTKNVLKNICNHVNIKPIRGQMLCVKTEGKIPEQIILDGDHYSISRSNGHMLIGSTTEDVGFDPRTTSVARQELLEWVQKRLPGLNILKIVRHWSGLRPSMDRDLPVIGKIPSCGNVYINSGHFRKGVLQAPASAKLLTDYLFGEASFMNIQWFGLTDREDFFKGTVL